MWVGILVILYLSLLNMFRNLVFKFISSFKPNSNNSTILFKNKSKPNLWNSTRYHLLLSAFPSSNRAFWCWEGSVDTSKNIILSKYAKYNFNTNSLHIWTRLLCTRTLQIFYYEQQNFILFFFWPNFNQLLW